MNLQLKNGYAIQREDANNVTLSRKENKTREDKKTGETVNYVATEVMFYPNLQTALRAYLNVIIEDNSVEEILKRIQEVETLINNIECK